MKKTLVGIIFLSVLILLVADCSRKTESPAEKKERETQGVVSAWVGAYDSLYASMIEALRGQDYLKALELAGSIKNKIWEESPLMLKNVTLVKGMDNIYGVYEPEKDDLYSQGEIIYLYLEPVGYKILKNEAGYYEFRFTADFQLVNENGEILGGQEQFADLPFKSRHPNQEIAITFHYNFNGIPSGKYKIVTTVKDANSNQKVSTETWVTIE